MIFCIIGKYHLLKFHSKLVKINLKTVSPSVIMKWFEGKEPLSDFGKIKLGEVHILKGDLEKVSNQIIEKEREIRISGTKEETGANNPEECYDCSDCATS